MSASRDSASGMAVVATSHAASFVDLEVVGGDRDARGAYGDIAVQVVVEGQIARVFDAQKRFDAGAVAGVGQAPCCGGQGAWRHNRLGRVVVGAGFGGVGQSAGRTFHLERLGTTSDAQQGDVECQNTSRQGAHHQTSGRHCRRFSAWWRCVLMSCRLRACPPPGNARRYSGWDDARRSTFGGRKP